MIGCPSDIHVYSIGLGAECPVLLNVRNGSLADIRANDGKMALNQPSTSEIYSRNPIADYVATGVPMSFMPIGQWQVHDPTGRRKYVSAEERRRFLAAADQLAPDMQALAYVLTYTGCRISEALSLGPHRLELEAGALVFQTLKRRRLTFRRVPVPPWLLAMLRDLPIQGDRYWPIHRATAWRCLKRVMLAAGIVGPMATCKGLRHAFGIHAAACGVPPNLIAKWLGHASLTTTAIYLDAVGEEEREFAARMW